MAWRSSAMPGPGGYWFWPLRMAATAASSTSWGPSVSGKPCPRFTAPVAAASADISAKMVVPKPSSLRLSGGRPIATTLGPREDAPHPLDASRQWLHSHRHARAGRHHPLGAGDGQADVAEVDHRVVPAGEDEIAGLNRLVPPVHGPAAARLCHRVVRQGQADHGVGGGGEPRAVVGRRPGQVYTLDC